MKTIILLAGLLFVAVVFFLVERRATGSQTNHHRSGEAPRKGGLFATDPDSLMLRSADNMRLLSDDQLREYETEVTAGDRPRGKAR